MSHEAPGWPKAAWKRRIKMLADTFTKEVEVKVKEDPLLALLTLIA